MISILLTLLALLLTHTTHYPRLLTSPTTHPPVRDKDPDPDGVKLAATEDPLAEATRLVVMLKTHAGDRLIAHTTAFEVGG